MACTARAGHHPWRCSLSRDHEDLCAGWQEDLTPDLADEETLAPAATGDEGKKSIPSKGKTHV